MAAIDTLASWGAGHGSEPAHAALVTPSDSTDLAYVTRAFSFKTAGDLKVTLLGGEVITFVSGQFAAGIQHSLRIVRVWATGTTVGDLVVFW